MDGCWVGKDSKFEVSAGVFQVLGVEGCKCNLFLKLRTLSCDETSGNTNLCIILSYPLKTRIISCKLLGKELACRSVDGLIYLLTYLFTSYLLIYFLTYVLAAWSRVLLEKLTGLQLVKKFPAFHGTWRFITAFTSVRHLFLSWASSLQSLPPTSNFLKIHLNTLPSTPASSKWSPYLRFSPTQPSIRLSSPPCPLHFPPISFCSILSAERYSVSIINHLSSSLCSFLQSPVTSSLLSPIFPSTPYSQTYVCPSMWASLDGLPAMNLESLRNTTSELSVPLEQCFSTFVRPRPGKFFFHKTRARSQQIYS